MTHRVRRRAPEPQPLTKERAYVVLFRRGTYGLVWYWLERLGVPPCDRADVAQDVLAAAWASWHTYDPARGRPERWLNRIAVHTAANYHADHRREVPTLADAIDAIDAPDHAPLAVDLMIWEQDRLRFLDLVHSLDPDLCSVLVGHDIDGIRMEVIAKQYGMPLSTAYKWRSRALAALAAMAQDAGYDLPVVA